MFVYINIGSKTSGKARKKIGCELLKLIVFLFFLARKVVWLIIDLGNNTIFDWVNVIIKKINSNVEISINILFILVTVDVIATVIVTDIIEIIFKVW